MHIYVTTQTSGKCLACSIIAFSEGLFVSESLAATAGLRTYLGLMRDRPAYHTKAYLLGISVFCLNT